MKLLFALVYIFLSVETYAKIAIEIAASPSCQQEVLSQTEVKNIFLKKRKYINGEYIVVLYYPDKILYEQFSKIYLSKTLLQMKTYWTRNLFMGKLIPPDEIDMLNLNKYNNTICYMSFFEKLHKPKHWKTIHTDIESF